MATFTYCIIIVSLFGPLCWASRAAAAPAYTASYCQDSNTTYPSNGTFHRNLNALLNSLASNASQDGGYYMTVMGLGSADRVDTVNGLFLCRGDLSTASCQDCVTTAAKEIISRCPNQTEALIWYDECMLRYTKAYFDPTSIEPRRNLHDDKNISSADMDRFNQSMFGLLNSLATEAAISQASKKFSTGQVTLSSSLTIYALEQCLNDLTVDQCATCLANAVGTLRWCCNGKQGARALLASCNVRYELYPFYNITATSGKKKLRSGIIVLIVVLVFVSVILLCFGCYELLRRSRKNHRTFLQENFGEELTTLESLQFNLATLEAATNKFSFQNMIGKGGFGEVYKGILPNGQEIAVKKLSSDSSQGAVEFKNEILLIAKLQHRNLVALLGFCLEEQEKMLIYEYVPNKSLNHFLFDSKRQGELNWSERYNIIGGIARGIHYLHDHSRLKVIHRDLKPSNVLLDDNMNPKISDFGIARMIATNEDQGNTKRIVGTFGYMSPEYAMHGQFSEKSDVFSFGVIVLEIISGKRNARSLDTDDVEDLLSYAWGQWRNQTPLELLDPDLKESYSQSEVIKCIQIGLLCVQDNPKDRPTMASVVSYLSSLLVELPLPRQPAFFIHGEMMPRMVAGESSSGQSTHCSVPSSLNDMTITTSFPR